VSLEATFNNRNFLPYEKPYANWTSSFWSLQQATTKPACIVQPIINTEVSSILLIARLTRCRFAVKSGGHAAFTGASSVPDGINIDLRLLRELTLSGDQKTAYIQPGNQWSEVYGILEKKGISVIGGRVSEIGVGGLTLGGGISFFSSEYGWACDNIQSYEV
jgi:FAD/FMN-containing dehydrogenase